MLDVKRSRQREHQMAARMGDCTIPCSHGIMFSMAMIVAKKSFLIVLISIAIASFFWVRHLRRRLTAIQGAVITRNSDPRKQLPIADVEITASDGISVVKSKSDAS